MGRSLRGGWGSAALVLILSLGLTSEAGCSLTRSLSDLSGGDEDDLNGLGGGDGSPSTSGSEGGAPSDGGGGGDAAIDGSDASGPIDTCAYRDCVLADSPAAYWRLGEAASAGKAVDESGHGHDATYSGGVDYAVAGAIAGDSNTAIHLDGTNGLAVGDVFLFDGKSPFSLEVWAKPTPKSGYAALLSRDDDPNGYALYFASNLPSFERQKSGDVDILTGTTITTSKYNHIVGTFDGSTLRLYVNGDAVASGPSVSSIPGASSAFYIGTDNASSSYVYEGDMDEPAVYDHALSYERILVHYRAGVGTK